MTLATFLQPVWLIVLLGWNFAVLAAAQLTIRLIMAFSVRTTFVGAVVLTIGSLVVALIYDWLVGTQASLALRLDFAPVAMVLEGLVGFAVARWVLRFRRLRGQVITGLMVGVLDPHLFALLSL